MQPRRHLELLVEVGRNLSGTTTLAHGLRTCLDAVIQELGARGGSIVYWDDADLPARVVGCAEQQLLESGGRVPLLPDMPAGSAAATALEAQENAFREGEPRDDAGFTFIRDVTDCAACKSTAVLPLSTGDRTVGVMCLGFLEKREFEPGTRDLLDVLASQLGFGVEAALQKAEIAHQRDLLDVMLSDAPVGVLYLDAHLTVRFANHAWCRSFGLTPAEVISRHVADSYPEIDDLLTLVKATHACGVAGQAEAIPFNVNTREGTGTRYLDAACIPIRKGDTVAGILTVGIDVTDRVQRLRQEEALVAHLRQIDEMKDDFLNTLSHELRTPINAIMGFGSVLRGGLAGTLSPKQSDYVQRVMGASEVLLSLVEQLLDVAHIQSQKLKLRLQPAKLPLLVREVVGYHEIEIGAKKLAVEYDFALDEPVLCDTLRLRQVLSNLIGNSVKFTPSGGRIAVRVRREPTHVVCEIDDTGIGIPEDQAGNIFGRFTQVDMTDSRNAGGLGLGLYIAKALIEAHCGEIGVRSAPGQGATFWFRLPAETALAR